MVIKLFFYIFLAFLLTNCGNNTQKKNEDICLSSLMNFSDTLNIKNTIQLRAYFGNPNFDISKCNFKSYRGNPDLEISIIRIILKIHKIDVQKGYRNYLVQGISLISSTGAKIIGEYSYLIYNEEIDYPEALMIDDVMKYVDNHKYLLEKEDIRKLYNYCIANTPSMAQ